MVHCAKSTGFISSLPGVVAETKEAGVSQKRMVAKFRRGGIERMQVVSVCLFIFFIYVKEINERVNCRILHGLFMCPNTIGHSHAFLQF